MIYVVTGNTELFENDLYTVISVEESLSLMKDWGVIQFDTETDGKNCHINHLLSMQFGNRKRNIQIVVDCTTINPVLYKNIIESKPLIGHNLKFDLEFMYSIGIIPMKVYDTMVVEQLLYLGFPYISILPFEYDEWECDFPYLEEEDKNGIPKRTLSFSLKAVAKKRINKDLDKTVRGEIIWRGFDSKVILYAAGDVEYLEDIMDSQVQDCIRKECLTGAQLECRFVPAIAYLEWCGIKLDVNKWQEKMVQDKKNLDNALIALNQYVMKNPKLQKWIKVDLQGDLFTGFDNEPKWTVDWQKKEAIQVIKTIGFNTTAISKATGKEADSVMEKVLKPQKGIDDEFLKLYFAYQEYYKVTTSFGQGHLDAINPVTGRLHTNFWQLGTASGRMSCGGGEDDDLAKYKKLPSGSCKLLNIQQLPADEPTRSSFVAEKGNMFVSCDFSAEESRLGADIYNDEAFRNEFLYGSKDTHNMFAWIVYNEECKALGCKDATDVKKLAPQWRKKVKGFEFGYMFGAAAPTLANTAGCSVEEAQSVIDKLDEAFKGMTAFAKRGAEFVKNMGYIVINPITGHRLNWWDWKQWKARQNTFDNAFWETYRNEHKGTGDEVAQMVKKHFQAVGKYGRLARNVVTQGTGAIILKDAMSDLFAWIVRSGNFGKVKICALVHDEANCEYPEDLKEFPDILKTLMENSASKYCKSLPIPAIPEISDHWVH